MVYSREYYLKNKPKQDLRNRKWREKNPDKVKQFNFKTKLKIYYNLTPIEYNKLQEKQNNACAICNKVEKLNVDHCHETNKVRGLLCSKCNFGLGQFQDDCDLLNKAIIYLNDFEKTPPQRQG